MGAFLILLGAQLIIKWGIPRNINLTLKLTLGLVDSGIRYAVSNHSIYHYQSWTQIIVETWLDNAMAWLKR